MSGHDFSRAVGAERRVWALAPEGSFSIARAPHLVLASFTLTPRISSWRTSIRSDFSPLTAVQSADLAAPPDLTLNPPHSLASDAWKGLVFSLMAANRNAEALGELNKIPADPRRLLEADIEWVQAIASLYVAVGDEPHANAYVHRVETFYLLHRAAVPAALEIQHAWLLYNLHSDAALYPVLTALDARSDLTADQRQQLQTLWANWAVRRANQDLAAGQLSRGTQILEAAAADLPRQPRHSFRPRRCLCSHRPLAGRTRPLQIHPHESGWLGRFSGSHLVRDLC